MVILVVDGLKEAKFAKSFLITTNRGIGPFYFSMEDKQPYQTLLIQGQEEAYASNLHLLELLRVRNYSDLPKAAWLYMERIGLVCVPTTMMLSLAMMPHIQMICKQ
ncbi:hypothetical protein VNO77_17129 [Canavalia gladiata]|uniref:Uncharacterized protein n=1 Tax=Canavalia gladiata TaxID=3824 RepID=A0AAN9LM21_CANGL